MKTYKLDDKATAILNQGYNSNKGANNMDEKYWNTTTIAKARDVFGDWYTALLVRVISGPVTTGMVGEACLMAVEGCPIWILALAGANVDPEGLPERYEQLRTIVIDQAQWDLEDPNYEYHGKDPK